MVWCVNIQAEWGGGELTAANQAVYIHMHTTQHTCQQALMTPVCVITTLSSTACMGQWLYATVATAFASVTSCSWVLGAGLCMTSGQHSTGRKY